MKKSILISITAAALAAVMTACGSGSKIHTYTTDDYVDVAVAGTNGNGHVVVQFDRKNFYEMLNRDIFDGKASDVDLAGMEVHLYDAVKINVSQKRDLSNGDVITITLDANNEKLEKYGIAFADDVYTYTIEGLEEESKS